MVMIGVDPHKRTHTAVAVDGREVVLGERLVQARSGQVAELVAWADEFDDRDRTWAVESAGGLGYLLSQQLLASATATPEPNNTLRPNLPPVDGPPKRARKPANNLLTNKEASICAEGSTAATTAACTPSGDGRTEVAGPRVSAMSARLRSRALNSRHQRPTSLETIAEQGFRQLRPTATTTVNDPRHPHGLRLEHRPPVELQLGPAMVSASRARRSTHLLCRKHVRDSAASPKPSRHKSFLGQNITTVDV